MKQTILFILFYGINYISISQVPASPYRTTPDISTSVIFERPQLDGEPLNFRYIQMIEDKVGFLWFSADGLVRYDGKELKTFLPLSQDSIPTKMGTWGMCLDHQGYIWIATHGAGLQRFDPRKETFELFDLAQKDTLSTKTNVYWSVLEDSQNRLWVGTRGEGVYLISANRDFIQNFRFDPEDARSISSNKISVIFEDSQNRIWLTSQFDGLNLYDETNSTFKRILFATEGKHKNDSNFPFQLLEDELGKLWITTWHGLFILNPDDLSFQGYFHDPNNPSSLSSNRLYRIFQDTDKRIFITADNGLNLYHPEQGFIRFYPENSNPNFLSHSLHYGGSNTDKKGTSWITTNQFINKIDLYTNNFEYLPVQDFLENKPNEDAVIGMVREDRSGKLWLYVPNLGLYLYDPYTKQSQLFQHEPNNPKSIGTNTIWGILPASDGITWVRTMSGLDFYDPEKGYFQSYCTVYPDQCKTFKRPMGFMEDRKGNIWMDGNGMGLYRMHLKTRELKHFPYEPENPEKIGIHLIGNIVEDQYDNLWLNGEGGGLHWFNPGTEKVIRFNLLNNLPENLNPSTTHPLFTDQAGSLWLKNEKGLFRAQINEEGQILDFEFQKIPNWNQRYWVTQDINKQVWINDFHWIAPFDTGKKFGEKIWIPDALEITTPITHLQSEQMVFGSKYGIYRFHPDQIRHNTQPPKVVITNFEIGQKPVPIQGTPIDTLKKPSPLLKAIPYTKSLELTYQQNDLSFEFAVLNFSEPEYNEYKYFLKGYKQDTIYTSAKEATALYTNLDPGDYILQVWGSNNEGVWSEESASIAITILPPWWQTWWAYLLWGSVIFGLIYNLYRFLLRRRLAEIEARKIKELDVLKTRLYMNITHEFRTPLTVILGLAEEIKTTSQQQIQAIKQNGRQLLQLVNQLLALSKLESGKEKLNLQQGEIIAFLKYLLEPFHSFAELKNIELRLECNVEELYMDYDTEKLQQVISNLIGNAIKFTPEGGWVGLKIEHQVGQLLLEIADNGAGIQAASLPFIFDRYYQVENVENTGSGIGLTLVKEYVRLFDGDIEVQSELGQGTTFFLRLPIHQNALLAKDMPDFQAINISSTPLSKPVEISADDKRPQLLLVEDNKDVQQYLSLILSEHYNLSYANDGQEGTQKALADIPDLIISDVMMPRKNGYELCTQLKKDERTSHIPIILLTAKADFDSKMEGLGLGADVYLNKPFQKQELLIQVNRLLKQRKRLQAHYSQLAMLPTKSYQVEQAEESFLYKAQKAIEERLDDPEFGIEALCKALHISRTHLYRKLKALTDKSIAEYIRVVRLNRGKNLLTNTNKNVSEIAFDVGFSSSSYFSRSFTKEFGVSPKTFRKNTLCT